MSGRPSRLFPLAVNALSFIDSFHPWKSAGAASLGFLAKEGRARPGGFVPSLSVGVGRMLRPSGLPWELLHSSDIVLQFFPSLLLGELVCLPVCLSVTFRLTMLLDTCLGIGLSHASSVCGQCIFLPCKTSQSSRTVLSQSMDDHTVDPANSQAVGMNAPSFRVI